MQASVLESTLCRISKRTPRVKTLDMISVFSEPLVSQFEAHKNHLKVLALARREEVMMKNVVFSASKRDSQTDAANYMFDGCRRLHTLRSLLSVIDARGFERSDHQLQFHAAFERCVARVLYRSEWATQKTAIMSNNNWVKCSSEVMVSTPRRFGKTFR